MVQWSHSRLFRGGGPYEWSYLLGLVDLWSGFVNQVFTSEAIATIGWPSRVVLEAIAFRLKAIHSVLVDSVGGFVAAQQLGFQ